MRFRNASVRSVEVEFAAHHQAAGFGDAEQGEVGHGCLYSPARKICGGSAAQAQWVGMRSINASNPT